MKLANTYIVRQDYSFLTWQQMAGDSEVVPFDAFEVASSVSPAPQCWWLFNEEAFTRLDRYDKFITLEMTPDFE